MEFLLSVSHARFEQSRLAVRVAELDTRCTKITPAWGDTEGGSGDAQRQWAILADERRRLVEQLESAVEQEHRVQAFLDRVRPTVYRDILTLRYVDLRNWVQIEHQMHRIGHAYSDRHIYRLHEQALKAARKLWESDRDTGKEITDEQKRDP